MIDTSDLSTKGRRHGRAQRRRRGRAAHQAHAGARRASARTRSPAGSSWSRTTCRWAAASSRWRAIPTSAQLITVALDQHHRGRPRASRARRARRATATRARVLWFTGLSGAGKSTLALALERELFAKGYQVYVLDGDNIRDGLNANLGFTPRGPGREHPPRRRGGVPVRRCRLHRHQLVHLALPLRPRAGAGRGQGRVPRDLRQGARSTPARSATRRASTSARARARSPSSPASAAPTRRRSTPIWWSPTDELPVDECLAS